MTFTILTSLGAGLQLYKLELATHLGVNRRRHADGPTLHVRVVVLAVAKVDSGRSLAVAVQEVEDVVLAAVARKSHVA